MFSDTSGVRVTDSRHRLLQHAPFPELQAYDRIRARVPLIALVQHFQACERGHKKKASPTKHIRDLCRICHALVGGKTLLHVGNVLQTGKTVHASGVENGIQRCVRRAHALKRFFHESSNAAHWCVSVKLLCGGELQREPDAPKSECCYFATPLRP